MGYIPYLYVLRRWEGKARIYDRSWASSTADVTVYCDIALEEVPKAGSFGKGALVLQSETFFSEPWEEGELKEAKRAKKHSTAHLELINMLDSVLRFGKETQKILCKCDSRAAVRIATARYSATANRDIERRLHEFDVECCRRDLSVRFQWECREGELPSVADALSRGEVSAPFAMPPLPTTIV